jgi:putative endonuclease
MRPPKQFFVYIMTNNPRSAVLYVGVTGNLTHRVWQHKNKLTPGFTSSYNLTQLVCYELFFDPDAAIDREKESKGWRRSKKIKLTDSMNPRWETWRRIGATNTSPNRRQIAGRSLAPLEKARALGMTPPVMGPKVEQTTDTGSSRAQAVSAGARDLRATNLNNR